jgi:hypothetical protein
VAPAYGWAWGEAWISLLLFAIAWSLSHTGERALAMGMTVLGFDPYVTGPTALDGKVKMHREFDEFLSQLDVISFHVPGGQATKHLLNRERLFSKCRPNLLVIEVTASNRFNEFATNSRHLTPDLLKQELVTFRELKGYLPDVVAILDLARGEVEVEISPLFFRGRYRKLERGIPQTRWPCRECRGAGCERCGFTGKMYADSVEELIGRTAAEAFQARDAVLHGAGREDIDASCSGPGDPLSWRWWRPGGGGWIQEIGPRACERVKREGCTTIASRLAWRDE